MWSLRQAGWLHNLPVRVPAQAILLLLLLAQSLDVGEPLDTVELFCGAANLSKMMSLAGFKAARCDILQHAGHDLCSTAGFLCLWQFAVCFSSVSVSVL